MEWGGRCDTALRGILVSYSKFEENILKFFIVNLKMVETQTFVCTNIFTAAVFLSDFVNLHILITVQLDFSLCKFIQVDIIWQIHQLNP